MPNLHDAAPTLPHPWLHGLVTFTVCACTSPRPVQADLPIQMFHSICDPPTPSSTLQNLFRTSPLQYTISASPRARPLPTDALSVCTVASCHYTRRPELYQQLLDRAKHATAKTPTIVINYD